MIDTQQMIDDLNHILEPHGFKVVCISSRLQPPVLEPEPASECGSERFNTRSEHTTEHPRTPVGAGSKLARIRAIMNRGAKTP